MVAVVAGLATSACGGGRTETAYSGDQTVTNEWDRKNVQCDGPGDLLIKHIIAVTVTNAGTPVAAGSLSIHKTCASGGTGNAVFDAKVTPFGQATIDVPGLSVECGSTVPVVIPTAANLVGATVVITETTAATGGVKATVLPVTLTAAAQTITVNNAKPSATPSPTPTPTPTPTATPAHSPTPTPTAARLPQTGRGGESGGLPIALLALSLLLVGSGAIAFSRRTR